MRTDIFSLILKKSMIRGLKESSQTISCSDMNIILFNMKKMSPIFHEKKKEVKKFTLLAYF